MQLERFVRAGYLVPVRGDMNLGLKGVSYPFVRPETRTPSACSREAIGGIAVTPMGPAAGTARTPSGSGCTT